MNNLIDREQAIAALGTITMYKGMIPFNTAMERIKRMPPAQLGTNLAEVGTDCISRQAAIEAFNTNLDELVVGGEKNAKTVENYLNRVLDKIKCLPPAQPKRGRWIGKYPVTSVCSECGFLIHDSKVKVFAFCPNCGAKMEVNNEID